MIWFDWFNSIHQSGINESINQSINQKRVSSKQNHQPIIWLIDWWQSKLFLSNTKSIEAKKCKVCIYAGRTCIAAEKSQIIVFSRVMWEWCSTCLRNKMFGEKRESNCKTQLNTISRWNCEVAEKYALASADRKRKLQKERKRRRRRWWWRGCKFLWAAWRRKNGGSSSSKPGRTTVSSRTCMWNWYDHTYGRLVIHTTIHMGVQPACPRTYMHVEQVRSIHMDIQPSCCTYSFIPMWHRYKLRIDNCLDLLLSAHASYSCVRVRASVSSHALSTIVEHEQQYENELLFWVCLHKCTSAQHPTISLHVSTDWSNMSKLEASGFLSRYCETYWLDYCGITGELGHIFPPI